MEGEPCIAGGPALLLPFLVSRCLCLFACRRVLCLSRSRWKSGRLVFFFCFLLLLFRLLHCPCCRRRFQCQPTEMVSLKLQKRLAASVLKCGKRKVWLDPNEVNEIHNANSRTDTHTSTLHDANALSARRSAAARSAAPACAACVGRDDPFPV